MKGSKGTTTPEQRRAEMEALHQQLAEGVETLRNSQTWAAYLRFCGSFHRYSFTNLMLIFMQNPEATRVAGYRAWQAKGRQVRKGERGLRIMGTVPVDQTDEETGEVVEGRRRIFFPVSVFDISQTDPVEGQDAGPNVVQNLTGEDEPGILARVIAYLDASGVPVSIEPLNDGAHGHTRPANEATGEPVRVVIEARIEPAQQAKTAIHEAAHIALGHLEDLAEYVAHRGRCEVEAESVAYVVTGMFGLDASAYSTGYIAGWAERAEADVLKATASDVLAAVRTISEALQIDVDDRTADAA